VNIRVWGVGCRTREKDLTRDPAHSLELRGLFSNNQISKFYNPYTLHPTTYTLGFIPIRNPSPREIVR
jgi:hypothetical protein